MGGMTNLLMSLTLALLTVTGQQENKPVPKDSMLVEARGCLKGRVFTATSPIEHEGALRGPDISGRHFRINGKKELTNQVKEHDGHTVEITGIVRKADLSEGGVGFKMGGARVVIGAQGTNPNARNTPTAPMMPTMDAMTLRFVQDRCLIQ
jgi:hypothetical protein